MIYDSLNSASIEMRTLILITFLLAFGEGNQMQSCWNGKGCLSDAQCGLNGSCRLPAMPSPGISPMINPGYVNTRKYPLHGYILSSGAPGTPGVIPMTYGTTFISDIL